MSNPFLGEIRLVGFNFAPVGWATCDGQILPISQNTALFSLLGTNFGGNGTSTFGLPNLQNSAPMFWGNGAGLTPRAIGQTGGETTVTLSMSQMPAHTHPISGNTAAGNQNSPGGASWSSPHLGKTPVNAYTANTSSNVAMNANALQSAGSNQPHNNLSPYLTMLFVIALQGIFPSRS